MARAYSLDLRERVIAFVASRPRRCSMSAWRVLKWTQRTSATDSAAAKPMGGKRPLLLEGERDRL
jgi:hypothetical protein